MALKRSKLRLQGRSTAAQLKVQIQALLRAIVIKRDGGCILRGKGSCTEILQAEHLITRGNSATYADTRNVVCLCSYHHIFFKKQHPLLYWKYIEEKVGKDRWDWIHLALEDRFRPHKMDWLLAKLALEQELIHTTPYKEGLTE